MPLNPYFQLLE